MKTEIKLLSPEAIATQERTDTLSPFSLVCENAGKTVVTAHPALLSLAEITCAQLEADAPFSDVTDALFTQLSTELLTMGYQIDQKSTLRGYILTDGKLPETPPKTDFSSPFDIKTVDNYRNLTTISLKQEFLSRALAFGVLSEGELLSLAVASPLTDGADAEVTLETAPHYRRRGLARASLFALTREAQRRGVRLVYRCREGNAASLAVARALGYTEVGRFYHCIGRRIANGLR